MNTPDPTTTTATFQTTLEKLARLEAEAKARGVTVDALLSEFIESQLPPRRDSAPLGKCKLH